MIKRTAYLKGRVGWKGLTSDEYLDEGYAYLVTGTDFQSKFINWAECHYVDRDRYEDDPFIQLIDNDLLITKDGTVGKLAVVADLPGPACLNSGIFLLRPTLKWTTEYMYWVLSSSVFQHFCELHSFGSTIQHLYQNMFERFTFPIPSGPEQAVISCFLDRETAKIDALVEEQRQLIELLKEKRQAIIAHAVTKGLDPNAPMKDSGVEWLGEVPAHWEVKATKRLFRLVVEPAPDENNFELLSIYTEIGVRPRKTLEAKGNKATTTDGYWMVQKGDLIVNKLLAWMGAIGISDYDGVTSPAYDILRKRIPLEPRYYDFLFRCGICFSEFRRYSRGIMDMRLRLYFDQLGQLSMPYPPETEQLEIVRFLQAKLTGLDALTMEAQRAIHVLQERRSALISAAVTGKIDVRGLAVEAKVPQEAAA
jgi:type I restriction enzyme S subunit